MALLLECTNRFSFSNRRFEKILFIWVIPRLKDQYSLEFRREIIDINILMAKKFSNSFAEKPHGFDGSTCTSQPNGFEAVQYDP